jgi:hypothetical protein
MSTDESRERRAESSPDVWSRQGNGAIVAPPPVVHAGSPNRNRPGSDRNQPGPDGPNGPDGANGLDGTIDLDDGGRRTSDGAADGRTAEWSALVSGPALALAAFVFASAQAISGFVAAQAANLIPSAADSPANHVRVVAVIYLGLSGAGALFAWVALRRTAADRADGGDLSGAAAPKWAAYVAAAAVVVSILTILQSLVLLMLSMLAPAIPPN